MRPPTAHPQLQTRFGMLLGRFSSARHPRAQTYSFLLRAPRMRSDPLRRRIAWIRRRGASWAWRNARARGEREVKERAQTTDHFALMSAPQTARAVWLRGASSPKCPHFASRCAQPSCTTSCEAETCILSSLCARGRCCDVEMRAPELALSSAWNQRGSMSARRQGSYSYFFSCVHRAPYNMLAGGAHLQYMCCLCISFEMALQLPFQTRCQRLLFQLFGSDRRLPMRSKSMRFNAR